LALGLVKDDAAFIDDADDDVAESIHP